MGQQVNPSGFDIKVTWVSVLAPKLISCVTSIKSLMSVNLSFLIHKTKGGAHKIKNKGSKKENKESIIMLPASGREWNGILPFSLSGSG